MKNRAKAEELAKRSYILMTSVGETTDDQPIYFARVLEMEGCFGQGETRADLSDHLGQLLLRQGLQVVWGINRGKNLLHQRFLSKT